MESVVDSASTASEVSGSSGGSPRVKAASSPARGMSPPQLLPPRMPLPPPGLGLLGSLQMMHHSPLELMAAAHHHGPPRYGSPPPISTSDPSANECKLVDYRGQKVAAFIIQGDTMLCLPQAFELFLKHLVGGLHTVYTKLKRLDIVPLVCNVEQVRILRGLGAIQPGVNRCKLLSCKDFDVLYRDCTTARCLSMKAPDRPGRPPKRASGVGLSLAATQFPGHPFKKHRLENGDYSPYENGHMSEMARMEKSPLLANGYNAPPTHLGPMGFMHQHALMSPGMPHHVPRPDGSIIKGQPMHNMEALARYYNRSGIWENCRAAYEDIVKHLERLRDERGDMERVMAMDKAREGSHNVSMLLYLAGSSPGHSPVLNLSKSGSGERERAERGEGSASGRSSVASRRTPQPPRLPSAATAAASPRSHTDESDGAISDQEDHNVKDEDDGGDLSEGERELAAATSPAPVSYAAATASPPAPPGDPAADTLVSSTETLLRNIQGLLKVAADNARQQERQISYEKAELKMDVLREREVKDNMERQLVDEQKMRVMYQKRLKKERKQRQHIQEQLEMELKRRQKIEEALKQSGAPQEILRIVTVFIAENLSGQQEAARPERESGPESQPPSAEPPPASPPYQRERTPDKPQWNYPPPPVDIMSGGAAFWQNYSESLAQELEMERKSRQQALDRDVKSPLSERAPYYKNSVLFSSAT
ncbi:dachshund homolog 2 isoform X2 [Plutella xylostella]|uniref:dachshund homolog 2 isoform X2 n=1 Tax=Plutella xylostella TaxID=51655 RepID=UPI002032B33D|nr:dachshund homolog 2 isoform X2 [Plutella xylostella]